MYARRAPSGGVKRSLRASRMDQLDIKQIREQMKLSQTQFAALLGISVGTLAVGSKAGASPMARAGPAPGRRPPPDVIVEASSQLTGLANPAH